MQTSVITNFNFHISRIQTNKPKQKKSKKWLIIICEISLKLRWDFGTKYFIQFTQEKHKNVVNVIIIYVFVRQSNLQWLKILSFRLNLLGTFIASFPATYFFR